VVTAARTVKVFRAYAEHLPLIEDLVRATHRIGALPGMSPERTLRILEECIRPERDLGHFLLVAMRFSGDVESAVDGYLWAEVMDYGDLWIHLVHAKHRNTGRELYRVIEEMARAAGLKRCVGFFWRLDRIRAYERRWNVQVIGHVVAKVI